jgi:predicted small integral membrane protein
MALFGLLGILNLLNWEGTATQVSFITSGSGINDALRPAWAVDSGLLVVLGTLFIGLGKISGGVCCAAGAWQMWLARDGSTDEFQSAKRWVQMGCICFSILFFGGFIYLASQFFSGWRTELGSASASYAFLLGASVVLMTLFVNQPELE